MLYSQASDTPISLRHILMDIQSRLLPLSHRGNSSASPSNYSLAVLLATSFHFRVGSPDLVFIPLRSTVSQGKFICSMVLMQVVTAKAVC